MIRTCGLPPVSGAPNPKCVITAETFGLRTQDDRGLFIANNYIFGGYTSETTACQLGCADNDCGYPALRPTFVNNLCAAASRNFTGTSLFARALDVAAAHNGDCPIIANNILDAQGSDGIVYELLHYDSSGNGQLSNECYQLYNNEFVPRGLPNYAYTYLNLTAGTSVDYINNHGNSYQQTGGNVATDPGYADENFADPTAEEYHLNASCLLKGLGTPIAAVTLDYDGQTRDPSHPTIGPDECP